MTAPLRPQRAYHQSGLYAARRAVEAFGARALPGPETPLGEALDAWRASLVADLGGDPSTAQRALVDLAVRTRLMLDSIDAYLLGLPSLVDKRHRRLWAVVRERQGLADALARYLAALGLERRARPVADLGSYLAQRGGAKGPATSSVSSVSSDRSEP